MIKGNFWVSLLFFPRKFLGFFFPMENVIKEELSRVLIQKSADDELERCFDAFLRFLFVGFFSQFGEGFIVFLFLNRVV